MRTVVVVNPTKVDDLESVRATLAACAEECGAEAPELVETTEDDPGFGQTRTALEGGAGLVCALGGDGTVRAVAQELVGTGVPLGLLPGGTGNLLARNVGAPVADLGEALRVALTGRSHTVDVGWLVVDPTDEQRGPGLPRAADNVHCFTVMAGLGFDARIMDDAPEGVKDKVGWAAYVASGGQHLLDDGFSLQLTADGETAQEEAARTVVVGNCGELTGGLALLPEAEIDDGVLDLAVLTPSGISGWLGVATRVLAGRAEGGPNLERRRARDLTLRVDPPQPTEVDGDVLVDATELRLVVQPGCLDVRVPTS